MAAVRGDFGRLEDLQRRVKEVANPGFRQAVAHRLAGAGIKLLADEFRASRDPYGNPWAPVHRDRPRDRAAAARRARAGKPARADRPLIDTGRLRAAATASSADTSAGTQVRISIPVDYASFHQDGTRRMVRRQIVPDRLGGLGPIWSAAFRDEIERAFRQAMGGRG